MSEFKVDQSRDSYAQIFRSTSIMGGTAALTFIIGVARNKAAAVFIGTSGVGFMAALLALFHAVGILAGLGIQMSAVREIAIASESGDKHHLSRTVLSLKRVCWLSGIAGAAFVAAASPWLSELTFGHRDYTMHIAVMGLTILLGNLSGGQMGVIQGMRRIGDLARVNLIAFGLGTVVAIAFFAMFGIDGVVPALLAASAIQLLVSWYFSRRVQLTPISMSWAQSFALSGGLLRLGIAFMWSALISSIVALAINAVINQRISLEALGIYTAAFTLSGMFINFVIRAMGADFYPRLSGLSNDPPAMNRLVNEQTEIGVLLVGPGLVATVCLAPWFVILFFSENFLGSVSLIHWFVLGVMQRVISWPLGFVLRAIGDNWKFMMTETLFHVSHLAFVLLGLAFFSLEGAAIGFFAMNLLTTVVIYWVVRRETGFTWQNETWRLMMKFGALVIGVFLLARLVPQAFLAFIGIVVSCIAGWKNLRELHQRLGSDHRLFVELFRIPGSRRLLNV